MREFYIATCSNCVFLAPYESSKRLHRYCKLHERLTHIACGCQSYMPKRKNRHMLYYTSY
nr:MAG TPA: hypothetical protein [Caudoviricetes sp.]